MSFRAKRELLVQIAPRYHQASLPQKEQILDEFIAATGYVRKYAIRLLNHPLEVKRVIERPRPPQYGREVQEALAIIWTAANGICTKRLIPFLPTLVASLERHGHLQVTDDTRNLLLCLSPATADRLLRPYRQSSRGLSTTKAGVLLKGQIPIRTFTDWNETQPGFFEADLVAHCGSVVEGSYLSTLVLTDVATGWTECLPLLTKSREAILHALDRLTMLLPFPLLGLDTDNGSEFINAELLAYCERHHITFTRGRAYRKNDQCFVEQKNGAIVRQMIGYDRLTGEPAYRQLGEVYRALRLYVNVFQPSMKLIRKERRGSHVQKIYAPAQTPLERVLTATILTEQQREYLAQVAHGLDPLQLLQQIDHLRKAVWQHALMPPYPGFAEAQERIPLRFERQACGGQHMSEEVITLAPSGPLASQLRHKPERKPHWWRSRPDPFADVWEFTFTCLQMHPERTAKSIFQELQRLYPQRFPDMQLRTLQRGVHHWRENAMLHFTDHWMEDDQFTPPVLSAGSAILVVASGSSAGQAGTDNSR